MGMAGLKKAPDPGTGPIPTGTTGTSNAKRGICRRSGGMDAGVGAGNVSAGLLVSDGSGKRTAGDAEAGDVVGAGGV